MLHRLGTAAVIAVALLVIACGGEEEGERATTTTTTPTAVTTPSAVASPTMPSVVTSTTIVGDLVKQVGGDRVSVVSIVPFETDVHWYSATPSDITKTSEADLLVLVGGGLAMIEEVLANGAEGSVLELTHDMDLRPFSEALAHADEDEHEGDGHADGTFDPHFWMDVGFAIEAVEAIRDELSSLDPAGADYYRERTEAYVADLREVDTEIREVIAGLPEGRRCLVTFHDAYGYFADRYGLTILGSWWRTRERSQAHRPSRS